MIKHLKYAFTAFLLMYFGAAVAGSDGGYISQRRHNLDYLSEELELSDEQKSQMAEVFRDEREKYRRVNEESHKRIKEVLNGEQFRQWEQLISQRRLKKEKDSEKPAALE